MTLTYVLVGFLQRQEGEGGVSSWQAVPLLPSSLKAEAALADTQAVPRPRAPACRAGVSLVTGSHSDNTWQDITRQ